jgi:hypothetical protein
LDQKNFISRKGLLMFKQKLSLRFFVSLFSVLVIGAGTAQAYPQYSLAKDATNCRACHGDFRASPYVSLSDGLSWGDDLHDVHRNTMLAGDCSTCHSAGGRFPVLLDTSSGGTGLDAISCTGCHGRMEDGTGVLTFGYGAGLRQHHWNAGEQICADCHDDANPANYTPAGEQFLPPYYSASDAAHPAMPSDPCNPSADDHPEDYAASTLGLDNDGDGDYDEADGDCAGATPTPTAEPTPTATATPTAEPTPTATATATPTAEPTPTATATATPTAEPTPTATATATPTAEPTPTATATATPTAEPTPTATATATPTAEPTPTATATATPTAEPTPLRHPRAKS